MAKFIKIACLGEREVKNVMSRIEKKIAAKIKGGFLSEKEIRDIEDMKPRPLADILDVQSVYADHLFKEK